MTNRHRLWMIGRIILICLVAGLIMVGIYLWQNLVFLGQIRPLPNTPHHLVIQDGTTEEDIALVSEGITLANEYFTSQLGAPLSNPIEIRLARYTPCLPFLPLASNPTGVADKNTICMNLIGYTWTEEVRQKPMIGLSIIAHEHFHNWQAQYGCLPGPNDHEYAWWVEGAATYVGWHTLVSAGMTTDAEVLDTMRRWGGFKEDLQPLASYEKRIQGDAAYALAYRAITDLIDRAGTPQSLHHFCQQVGEGKNWRDAFQSAYGVSVDDFYAEFEPQRS